MGFNKQHIMGNYSFWLKVPHAAVKSRLKIHANFPADIVSKEQTLSGSELCLHIVVISNFIATDAAAYHFKQTPTL